MTDQDPGHQATASLRIDRWLWAARFFKTRSSAAQAVSGGKVQVNGERVKPARTIRAGDELRIRRDNFEFVLRVIALSARRGPASEARTLYEEEPDSIRRRAELAELLRAERAFGTRPAGRPDKKQRRKVLRFKQGGY